VSRLFYDCLRLYEVWPTFEGAPIVSVREEAEAFKKIWPFEPWHG